MILCSVERYWSIVEEHYLPRYFRRICGYERTVETVKVETKTKGIARNDIETINKQLNTGNIIVWNHSVHHTTTTNAIFFLSRRQVQRSRRFNSSKDYWHDARPRKIFKASKKAGLICIAYVQFHAHIHSITMWLHECIFTNVSLSERRYVWLILYA